jgi:Subtilisin-like serine proteases
MVVSMVATGAMAGAVGAQPQPQPTTENPALSNSALTESGPDQSVSTQQTTAVSDSQPAQVADQLTDASGETTVILLVDRDIQQSLITSGEATSTELQQDSRQTLQPVKDQIGQLSTAEVQHEYWVGNALSVEIDLDQSDISTLAEIPGVSSVIPNVQFDTPPQPALTTDADSDEIRTDGITPSLEAGDFTYGLQKIGIPSFEEQFDTDGQGATVAIIDDGISNPTEGHPDLEFAQTAVATDGVITEGTLGSPGAHGEHVSGTATGAADPAGDVPRYGVAPNASLIEVNAFEEGAFLEDILAGVEYAVEEDADVAGMSLGFPPTNDKNPMINAVNRQMEEANAAGTLVSVSAGNSGNADDGGPVTSPATEFGAFSVGASVDNPVNIPELPPILVPLNTGFNGDIVFFSSGGVISDRTAVDSFDYPDTYPRQYVQPDVSAPGAFVISAGPLGTTEQSLEDPNATYSHAAGTSMAQPHVAGAVALIQSATAEDLSPKQIEAALVETAEKPAIPSNFTELNSRDIRYGAGIINVTAATLAAQSENLEIEGTVTDTPVPRLSVQQLNLRMEHSLLPTKRASTRFRRPAMTQPLRPTRSATRTLPKKSIHPEQLILLSKSSLSLISCKASPLQPRLAGSST